MSNLVTVKNLEGDVSSVSPSSERYFTIFIGNIANHGAGKPKP